MSDLLLPPGKPDPVADFCQGVFAKHSEQWPVSEDTLAGEFLAFSGFRFGFGLEDVCRVCHDRLGISVSHTALPDGLRGHNLSYAGKREILLSANQDFNAATLHTLLHELREILESEFSALGHLLVNVDDSDMEERAEDFAIAVQVSAAHQLLPVLWENAATIERTWLRMGAYVFIIIGALAYTLSCTAMAQIEDMFAAQRSSRQEAKS